MTKSWTPVFSTMVMSSVWSCSKDVKILWVTMLALKDRNGFVECSVPGLARFAVLTVDECLAALAVLEAPDPLSQTPDNEGRRIRACERGWLVLNHALYQAEMSKMKARARKTEWQSKFRAKSKLSKGEAAYIKAEQAGASQEQLDAMIDRS